MLCSSETWLDDLKSIQNELMEFNLTFKSTKTKGQFLRQKLKTHLTSTIFDALKPGLRVNISIFIGSVTADLVSVEKTACVVWMIADIYSLYTRNNNHVCVDTRLSSFCLPSSRANYLSRVRCTRARASNKWVKTADGLGGATIFVLHDRHVQRSRIFSARGIAVHTGCIIQRTAGAARKSRRSNYVVGCVFRSRSVIISRDSAVREHLGRLSGK